MEEFKGQLPEGIDPDAHGLPLDRALQFFGEAQKIELVARARRSLWVTCKSVDDYKNALDLTATLEPIKSISDEVVRSGIERVRVAISERLKSVEICLAGGSLVAFSALPKNQGVYQWIPAAEAANIGALRKKLNVYIVDRWGIPTRQAIGAFCSQGLVDELIAWECQGVGLGTFRSSFDDERSYNASFKAALTELADLVASDRLIVPGLDKKKIAINLQTGLRPISVLQNELFRLPLPLESQVDVAPPKIRKAGGKPSFFEWGPPMMAASIQFGGEQYLERRGLTTEISKFIRIYLANTKLYPDEPAKSTLDEKASLVIREIQKHRNKKASE